MTREELSLIEDASSGRSLQTTFLKCKSDPQLVAWFSLQKSKPKDTDQPSYR